MEEIPPPAQPAGEIQQLEDKRERKKRGYYVDLGGSYLMNFTPKIGFDTVENEPREVCPHSMYIFPSLAPGSVCAAIRLSI